MGLPQEVRALFNAGVGSGSIVITQYPTAVAPLVNTTGVVCTADAAGSKYGAVATIAAAGPAVPFWLAGYSVGVASAADSFIVALTLGAGDTLAIECGIIDITAVTVNVPPQWFRFPVRSAASAKIGAKIANFDAVARTLNVTVLVATGVEG